MITFLKNTPVNLRFSDVYGCGSYGSGTYDKSSQCTTAPNTGYAPQNVETQQSVSWEYLILGIVLLVVAACSFVALSRGRRRNK